CQQHTSHPLTF
nr:immunoglobulin light chain junction region [Macaca mulatta]